MNDYRYEDLTVGTEEYFSVEIKEEMLEAFRGITEDVNPLHTDREFAIRNKFPDRVVYGMLTASFLSTLAGVYLPGRRSLIQGVETKFLRPVFIGDILCVKGVVSELNNSVRQIVLDVEVSNQGGQKVVSGKMKVGILDERK